MATAVDATVDEVLEAFKLAPPQSEKGAKFEKPMVSYFQPDPKLSRQDHQVSRWTSQPHREGTADTGIGSVLMGRDTGEWSMVHRHQDLQPDFRDRIAARGTDPEPVRMLKECFEILTVVNHRMRKHLRDTISTTAMLERHIAVEALEYSRSPAVPTPAMRLLPVPEPVQPADEPPSNPKG